jgi:hypothetical protein
MTTSDRLREQIDACRAGSDDLSLPAWAELSQAVQRDAAVAAELARSQRFDVQVRAALDDMPIPAELAQRLIAAAQASQPTADVVLPMATAIARQPSARRFRWTRRSWLVAGASAAALLVAASSLVLRRPRRVVTEQQLASEVMGWLKPPDSGWQPIGNLPPGIAIDAAVAAKPLRWQRITVRASGWTGNATAFELAPAGSGPRAFLFVVNSSARFSVPTRPVASTRLALSGGFTGTAWQRQDSNLLFVLAVEDGRVPLEHYLRIGSEA